MELLNWLGRLVERPFRKKKKWTRPFVNTFQDLPQGQLRHIHKHGSCPYCHSNLYEGPHGGMNINVYCGNPECASAFNIVNPDDGFGYIPWGQFIGRPPEDFLKHRRLEREEAD